MLKMMVRPLAIKNSNMPNRTPLRVDMTISSSKAHRLRVRDAPAPKACSGRTSDARERSVRPFHFAGSWKHGLVGLDLGCCFPAPAGLLLVERFLVGALPERGDIHRLEKLVVVLAHGAFAAVVDVELHAFERCRDFYRLDRL